MENEEAIYLSEFEPKVSDGDVNFLILDAKYDMIKTKRDKNIQIVKLRMEVQELDNPSGEKETKSITLFVNRNPEGAFHKFVKASLRALRTTAFQPSLLVNLKGKAVLSHYTPEGSERSFPRINNWVFYSSSQEVAESLANYQEKNEFHLEDDDIDFDSEEEDGKIV